MDLEIKDVSEFLRVSEETIEKWVNDGEIPAYRIKDKIRFNRIEIENWMLKRRQKGETFAITEDDDLQGSGRQLYALYRAINRGGVLPNVPGLDKEEVIHAAMRFISVRADFDAESMSNLFLEREELMATGLGNGVAVPHTRDFLMQEPRDLVVVVYPLQPIPYGSLDGEDVHTLFFLFASSDKMHLQLLSKISHLAADKEALALLKEKAGRNKLLPFIKEWESGLRTSS